MYRQTSAYKNKLSKSNELCIFMVKITGWASENEVTQYSNDCLCRYSRINANDQAELISRMRQHNGMWIRRDALGAIDLSKDQ